MFVVGAALGGAVIGVAVYDDHSDYSRYSRYSDAAERERRARIESLKLQIDAKSKEIEQEKNNLNKRVQEAIEAFKSDLVLANAYSKTKGTKNDWQIVDEIANKPTSVQKQLLKNLQSELETSLEKDKKELIDIDAAIMRINELQLTYKDKK